MSRPLSRLSLSILKYLDKYEVAMFHELKRFYVIGKNAKRVYDSVFRLDRAGLITLTRSGYTLTPKGAQIIDKTFPKRDGIWKIVIFDIPERRRKVRAFLRSRLHQLNFRRWQNSIWITPYALDRKIEQELGKLAKHYFVRLIKTTKINYTDDLKKLFPEG